MYGRLKMQHRDTIVMGAYSVRMANRRTEQPAWITDLADEVVEELVEHVAARVEQLERAELDAGREGLLAGQLAPALLLAIQDRLKPALDDVGRASVESYTEARRSEGIGAGQARGEELGPLMGLSRVGVYHAFGRQAPRPR